MIHCEDGKHILMSADLRGSFFDWCQANHVQLTRDQVDGIQNGEIPLVVFDALQMMQFAEYFAAIMAEIDRKVEQAKAMDALRKAIDRYSQEKP